jgi:mono/diheme cytochrome c family protein
MRRRALVIVGSVLLLAGCGSGTLVSPVPQTVQGALPKPQVFKGNPVAGKAVFLGKGGCGSCHTFRPAGTKAKVGPDLDKLAADAAKANQGSLTDYVKSSIENPDAYIVPGFAKGIMSAGCCSQLNQQQIADLVAFLTKKS